MHPGDPNFLFGPTTTTNLATTSPPRHALHPGARKIPGLTSFNRLRSLLGGGTEGFELQAFVFETLHFQQQRTKLTFAGSVHLDLFLLRDEVREFG